MKRITFHLSGVKPQLVEIRKKNKDTGAYDYIKKTVIYNTIAHLCTSEEDGRRIMSSYVDGNRNLKVTKHYFTNVN